jgi:hypothetical protein
VISRNTAFTYRNKPIDTSPTSPIRPCVLRFSQGK